MTDWRPEVCGIWKGFSAVPCWMSSRFGDVVSGTAVVGDVAVGAQAMAMATAMSNAVVMASTVVRALLLGCMFHL